METGQKAMQSQLRTLHHPGGASGMALPCTPSASLGMRGRPGSYPWNAFTSSQRPPNRARVAVRVEQTDQAVRGPGVMLLSLGVPVQSRQACRSKSGQIFNPASPMHRGMKRRQLTL